MKIRKLKIEIEIRRPQPAVEYYNPKKERRKENGITKER